MIHVEFFIQGLESLFSQLFVTINGISKLQFKYNISCDLWRKGVYMVHRFTWFTDSLLPTCRKRSCCGSTRAGHPAGSSPCPRCEWRMRMAHAPARLPWPLLPQPEGGAAGLVPGCPGVLTRLWPCSSPTPPRSLLVETRGVSKLVLDPFTL